MTLHKNAKLTPLLRQHLRQLYQRGQSVSALARRFAVNRKTASKWAKRADSADSKGPVQRRKRVLTPDYEQTVLAYRQAHPERGARRLVADLRADWPQLRVSTVEKLLREHNLTGKKATAHTAAKPLKVGKHRVQMDIQQLPAVGGGQGFDGVARRYKVSVIHLATRFKYSEIHAQATTEVVAQVVRNAMEKMPPFF